MTECRENKVQSSLNSSSVSDCGNAWVLTTKQVGDHIAGWVVEQLFENSTRELATSERCGVTAFCYPTGAKVIRARLYRADS